jgi:hypothetical protein
VTEDSTYQPEKIRAAVERARQALGELADELSRYRDGKAQPDDCLATWEEFDNAHGLLYDLLPPCFVFPTDG